MQIVCTESNAWVAGYRVPVGVYEFPLHGGLVVSNSVGSNYVSVGMSDTLFISESGVGVESGPDAMMFMVAGFSFALAGCGIMGFARWIGRKLGASDRVDW